MEGCKPCATPIKANHRLKEDDSERFIDAGRFQCLVGCLLYLSLIRPNITYVISVLNQFIDATNPSSYGDSYQDPQVLERLSMEGSLIQETWSPLYRCQLSQLTH